HRHINQALGLSVDSSSAEVKIRLENPSIGWAYIDQNSYCKAPACF
ncbi:MAG: hypothetical protein HAW58_02265, partial [Candidatus Thioglobus sp.]|nr:hypothetical protein [Candidatus Thioglobus sp.]